MSTISLRVREKLSLVVLREQSTLISLIIEAESMEYYPHIEQINLRTVEHVNSNFTWADGSTCSDLCPHDLLAAAVAAAAAAA